MVSRPLAGTRRRLARWHWVAGPLQEGQATDSIQDSKGLLSQTLTDGTLQSIGQTMQRERKSVPHHPPTWREPILFTPVYVALQREHMASVRTEPRCD